MNRLLLATTFGCEIVVGCSGTPNDSSGVESPRWSSIQGTLEYDVFLSDDQSEGVVHERYRDSESLLQHIANLGELMSAIMEVASFTGEICGTPSPTLVKAFEGSVVRHFKLHQSL